jgi:hypothetical protein
LQRTWREDYYQLNNILPKPKPKFTRQTSKTRENWAMKNLKLVPEMQKYILE